MPSKENSVSDENNLNDGEYVLSSGDNGYGGIHQNLNPHDFYQQQQHQVEDQSLDEIN